LAGGVRRSASRTESSCLLLHLPRPKRGNQNRSVSFSSSSSLVLLLLALPVCELCVVVVRLSFSADAVAASFSSLLSSFLTHIGERSLITEVHLLAFMHHTFTLSTHPPTTYTGRYKELPRLFFSRVPRRAAAAAGAGDPFFFLHHQPSQH